MNYVYRNPRPHVVIECTGGRSLGNCYSAAYWRVTSTIRLSGETLKELNQAGVLGFGQEFFVHSPCDGTEPPTGEDDVACIGEDDDGRIVDLMPKNPYSGEPYGSTKIPYWQYRCESRVDSSD